ncbi:RNA dependent RNA polymerase-domain-containing protein, partial [Blyttiomyces helicus]
MPLAPLPPTCFGFDQDTNNRARSMSSISSPTTSLNEVKTLHLFIYQIPRKCSELDILSALARYGVPSSRLSPRGADNRTVDLRRFPSPEQLDPETAQRADRFWGAIEEDRRFPVRLSSGVDVFVRRDAKYDPEKVKEIFTGQIWEIGSFVDELRFVKMWDVAAPSLALMEGGHAIAGSFIANDYYSGTQSLEAKCELGGDHYVVIMSLKSIVDKIRVERQIKEDDREARYTLNICLAHPPKMFFVDFQDDFSRSRRETRRQIVSMRAGKTDLSPFLFKGPLEGRKAVFDKAPKAGEWLDHRFSFLFKRPSPGVFSGDECRLTEALGRLSVNGFVKPAAGAPFSFELSERSTPGVLSGDECRLTEALGRLSVNGLVKPDAPFSFELSKPVVVERRRTGIFDIWSLSLDVFLKLKIMKLVERGHVSPFAINQKFVDLIVSVGSVEVAELLLDGMIARSPGRIYYPAAELARHIDRTRPSWPKLREQHMDRHDDVNVARISSILISPTRIYPEGRLREAFSNRILRTYDRLHDHFARISFIDDDFNPMRSDTGDTKVAVYRRVEAVLHLGIDLIARKFEFLHYSSSPPDEEITCQHIQETMGSFDGIHSPALLGARPPLTIAPIFVNRAILSTSMAQAFSSTIVPGTIKNRFEIADVARNGYIFSDGVGMIGRNLAGSVFYQLGKAQPHLAQIPVPSAFQFRLGGFKGVLAVTEAPHLMKRLLLRPSQKKFESKSSVLEICRPSFFSPGRLNHQYITVLETLGIPTEIFVTLARDAVADLRSVFESPLEARGLVAQVKWNWDSYGVAQKLTSLIDAGFHNDPFLTNLLRLFVETQTKAIKKRANVCIEKAVHLIGVMDEERVLQPGQIFIQTRGPEGKKGSVIVEVVCAVDAPE